MDKLTKLNRVADWLKGLDKDTRARVVELLEVVTDKGQRDILLERVLADKEARRGKA